MGQYLISGRNADGRQITRRVLAPSAQEALDSLLCDGLTELKVLTDDFQPQPAGRDRQPRAISPRQEARLQISNVPLACIYGAWLAYRQIWALALPALGLLIWRRVSERPWSWSDGLAVLILLFPWMLICAALVQHRTGQKVLRADLEARWDDLISLVPKARRALRSLGPLAAEMESTTLHAKALAGKGNLGAALSLMEPLGAREGVDRFTYLSNLARVYSVANDREAVLGCLEEMATINPAHARAWLGLAEHHALRRGDAGAARAAFEKLRALPRDSKHDEYVDFIEGAVLLAEGEYGKSRAILERVLQSCADRGRSMQDREARAKFTRAVLSLACAGAGDLAAAREHFSHAERFLTAHRDGLLARCRAAVGVQVADPQCDAVYS